MGQMTAAAMTLLAWLGGAARPLVVALALITGVLPLTSIVLRRRWPA
jgi:hypothetical protein